jgi:single-strand DNA-binding protein
MASIICVTGHVVADGEHSVTPSGTSVLRFKVGVNTGFGQHKKATFWRCTLFGKQADSVAPYVTKGKLVFVSGEASAEVNEYNGKHYLNADINVNELQLLSKSENRIEAADAAETADPDSVPF